MIASFWILDASPCHSYQSDEDREQVYKELKRLLERREVLREKLRILEQRERLKQKLKQLEVEHEMEREREHKREPLEREVRNVPACDADWSPQKGSVADGVVLSVFYRLLYSIAFLPLH
jgi:hypothetical protein